MEDVETNERSIVKIVNLMHNGNMVVDVPCPFCGNKTQDNLYLNEEKKLARLKKAVKRNPEKAFLLQERVVKSEDSKRKSSR